MTICSNVWAYGGGSRTKACNKPRFSELTPVNNAQVTANSPFSFVASASTYPDSIKVTIKDQSIPVSITPKNSGFEVSVVVPESVNGTYARINISAEGPNKCKGSGGCLLKVNE
ncbi:MAG: hypothetical protein HOP23_04210 [Methylococcaceae bacterium]|nr:hypothetical protein [Methylococcaceae bacterium]